MKKKKTIVFSALVTFQILNISIVVSINLLSWNIINDAAEAILPIVQTGNDGVELNEHFIKFTETHISKSRPSQTDTPYCFVEKIYSENKHVLLQRRNKIKKCRVS